MSVLNLSALRSELGQKIKNTTIGNTRYDRWLNLAQDDVARNLDPKHLIETTTFSTAASQRVYYIEAEWNKILSVVDTTSRWILQPRSENQIEEYDPAIVFTGTPFYYSWYGVSYVQAQPTSASAIRIVSSAAGDNSQQVRINGLVSGIERTELLTLNGTTNVNGTVSFNSVTQIAKTAVTTGTITVTSNSGAVTIVTIGPDQLSRQFQPLYLEPTPTDVRTIRVRYIRKPRRLVNAEDLPDFPEAYHEIVLTAAAAKGLRDLFDYDRAAKLVEHELIPMISALKDQQGTRAKISPVIGGTRQVQELARLPAQYGVIAYWLD